MFNEIFNPSRSNCFFTLILIVLFCFIFSLASCTTTETYTVNEPNTIKHDGIITVDKVILRDSTVYNFKEDDASYKKKYKDTSEVVVFNSKKEITDSTVQKISRSKYLLFLKDLASIKYKRTYVSTSDALLTGGVILVGVGLLFCIAIISFFNSGKKWSASG